MADNGKETENDEDLPDVNFYESDLLSDVVLLVEDRRLYTSRSLLAYASPVFKCMFTSQFKEKKEKEIPLPGKTARSIEEFLKFIHPGIKDNEIGVDSAFRLLPLAEEYQVSRLLEKCEDVLLQTLYGEHPIEFVIQCLQAAERFSLEKLRDFCVEKCSLSRSLWKCIKESLLISAEMKNRVFEERLKKLEEENDELNALRQRMVVVKHRLQDIIAPHENHCRCRTELKLRSSMQRVCNYCARSWCSDHVSTESYRGSYWFFCNHRIGYNVANDGVLKSFIDSKDLI